MSDDSFFREVDEELRQERFKSLWNRYGVLLIGAAVLLVLLTAAWRGYDYWTERQANASGDRFLAALQLANEGRSEEALAALEALQQDGYGAYPVLARMRAATVFADRGDVEAAVRGFDAVSEDTAVPQSIRNVARLRAGLLLVDHGDYADVARRVELLAVEGNALRHSAREALGLAAWKAGNGGDALTLFEQIEADQQAPSALRLRAAMMAELIRSSGTAG